MKAGSASDSASQAESLTGRRTIFITYAIALTIGTHWPKLRIDSPLPNTDKIIHFLAFAGLTLFLWRTKWISSIWLLLVLVIPWVALDEWSQNLPGLNRIASMLDFIAGAAGATIVILFLAIAKRR